MTMIGEVKNRDNDPFSRTEAGEFLDKMETLKEMEQIADAIGFVYSLGGFSRPALDLFTNTTLPTAMMSVG